MCLFDQFLPALWDISSLFFMRAVMKYQAPKSVPTLISYDCSFQKSETFIQRHSYRVLQTMQMKLILLWVWAERAVLGRAKTALKFKYEI